VSTGSVALIADVMKAIAIEERTPRPLRDASR
jgi:hypothetical protein